MDTRARRVCWQKVGTWLSQLMANTMLTGCEEGSCGVGGRRRRAADQAMVVRGVVLISSAGWIRPPAGQEVPLAEEERRIWQTHPLIGFAIMCPPQSALPASKA